MIQSCWVAVGSRSSAICGSAKLSTVLSTETSSTGSMSTTSAIQPRRGARAASTARVVSSWCASWPSSRWVCSSCSSCSHPLLYRPVGIVTDHDRMPLATIEHMSRPPAARESGARRVRAHPHRRRRARRDAGCHGARRRRLQGRPALPLRVEGRARRRGLIAPARASSTTDIERIDRSPDGADLRTSCARRSPSSTRSTVRSSRPRASPRAGSARRGHGDPRRAPAVARRGATARRRPHGRPRIMLISDGLYFNSALARRDRPSTGVDAAGAPRRWTRSSHCSSASPPSRRRSATR